MVQHMELYNKQRATCGYRPISIGVGIHTGNLILGIIGDQGRMQGTVISDAVNLASRIQDVTKLYGANIIISQESFIKLENPTAYGFRFLGKVRVKGKNQSVSLFEIFDGDLEEMQGAKNETKTDFESAILHFSKKEFEEAAELFKRIIAANPHDKAARLFLEKAEMFIAQEKRKFLFSG
jgi:two-component system sensor histidine kinase ChiS